jgi:DNA-binding transcriptional LysR family regulator
MVVRDRSRIDWNLVPALDALLTERNVSRAGRRLGLSQPSMSGALARLRRHYGDDLLVRQGSGYVLTPLAERLLPLAREAVASTSYALASSLAFDFRHSTRTFTIAASEYVQTVLGQALSLEINRQAPGVRLAFVSPLTRPFRSVDEVLHTAEGWLAPREVLTGHRCTGLLADRWVCVVTDDHPTVRDSLTLQDLRDLSWVAPVIRAEPLRLLLDGLGAHGLEPTLGVTTDSFTAVPFLVAGTDRVGLMQASLANRLAAAAGVRVLPCPWEVQALHVTFGWDAKREADPAHAWLRSVVEQVLVKMGSPDEGVES